MAGTRVYIREVPEKDGHMLNLELLNRVHEGILNGELKHDQNEYFCGTSACYAGWICRLVAEAKDPDLFNETLNESYSAMPAVDAVLGEVDYWDYAADAIGLTEEESVLIFHQKADVETQSKVIRMLNEGVRFTVLGFDLKEYKYESGDHDRLVKKCGL